MICCVVGIVVWLINAYLPIDASIKKVITIAAVVVLVLILLQAMGIFGGADVQIPRIR
jgi:hypothetical protein